MSVIAMIRGSRGRGTGGARGKRRLGLAERVEPRVHLRWRAPTIVAGAALLGGLRWLLIEAAT